MLVDHLHVGEEIGYEASLIAMNYLVLSPSRKIKKKQNNLFNL
jgi:hypothetical protein